VRWISHGALENPTVCYIIVTVRINGGALCVAAIPADYFTASTLILGLLMPPAFVQVTDTAQGMIPVGTKITMQNWQQYKQFMPDGMVALFGGNYFWKMSPDVEMDVGPAQPENSRAY
jgi:hypothetical protein